MLIKTAKGWTRVDATNGTIPARRTTGAARLTVDVYCGWRPVNKGPLSCENLRAFLAEARAME